MKKNFNIDEVIEALSKSGCDQPTKEQVKKFLASIPTEEKGERAGRVKRQYVGVNMNEAVYVLGVSEDYDPNNLIDDLTKLAKNYNESLDQKKKGKKTKIFNLVDVFESMPKKILKEDGFVVVNKSPLWMIESQNIKFINDDNKND